jgi:hemoglobin
MGTKAGTKQTQSLFEKLGGTKTIEAVVDAFYVRMLADPELKHFFTKTNMKWLKLRQTQFFTQALGGPAIYKGKDMKAAHTKMKIAARDFDLTAGHLVETLKAAGVSRPDIDTIVSAVTPLAKDIVNSK